MLTKRIPLPFEGKENAYLDLYVPTVGEKTLVTRRPTVLVIPGGGYSKVSYREGECIALRFMTEGFNAAVLCYSTKEDARFPQSLCEAALAMAHLKENADTYGLDPERFYTCGFSAGGHLALSLGVFWDKEWLSRRIGKDCSLLRPTAQILAYPVVVTDPELGHSGSVKRLVGEAPDKEALDLVSLEKQVSEKTPPTFLWTTQTDHIVPVENSLILATCLQKVGVPLELHVYGWGRHGLSLANRQSQNRQNYGKELKMSQNNPHIATWLPLCFEWLDEMFGVTFNTAQDSE